MRILATIGLILLGTCGAQAADVDCEAMGEVLDWTAEVLIDIRDGKPANTWYIARSIEFAAYVTAEADWPENTSGVLAELAMLADGILDRGRNIDSGDLWGLVGYADALAVLVGDRCGPDSVPAFVRPGVADSRACPQVIEALEVLGKAMPSLRGEQAPIWLLPVVTNANKAAYEAQHSEWSADSIAALLYINAGAVRIIHFEGKTGERAVARMLELASTVGTEARAVCKGHEIPMLTAAGR